MRGWADWLVAGAPWAPLRGRAPERIVRPAGFASRAVAHKVLLTAMLALYVVEDGWWGWLARATILLLAWTVLDSFRDRTHYRTAVALPPGEDDVLLTGMAGRSGRARRTLRRVFGLGLRQSAALTRAVSRPSSGRGRPVRLVRGTQREAAEALAGRLRDGGLTVEVVATPSGEIVASFRP